VEFHSFDAAYLERLAAGNPETERHFHSYFGQLILIKLRARRYTDQQVDDIRQETFLRVLRALRAGEIREPASLGSFVNSVCRFVMLEFHRTASRQTTAGDDLPDVPDERANSEEAIYSRERQQMVRKVLARLTPRNRELLCAAFFEDLPSEEICRRFGVDGNYLRVLLFRARNEFREHLLRS